MFIMFAAMISKMSIKNMARKKTFDTFFHTIKLVFAEIILSYYYKADWSNKVCILSTCVELCGVNAFKSQQWL